MGQIGGIYFKDDEEDKKKKTPSQVAREQNNADRGQIGSIRYSSTYKPVYPQEPQVALQQPVQEVEPVEQESKLKTSVDKTFDVIGNIFKAIGKGELNKAATINSATQKSIKKQGDLLASPYDKSALEQREYQVIKQGVLKSSSKVETQAEVLKRKQDNPIEYLINRPYAKTDEGYLSGDVDKTPMEVMNERLKTAADFYNSLSKEDKIRILTPDFVDEDTFYATNIWADDTIGRLQREIDLIDKQLSSGSRAVETEYQTQGRGNLSDKDRNEMENRKEQLQEYIGGLEMVKKGDYTKNGWWEALLHSFDEKEDLLVVGDFFKGEKKLALMNAYGKMEKGEELSERQKMLIEEDDIGDTIDYLTNEYTLGHEITTGLVGSAKLMAEIYLVSKLFTLLGLGVEGIELGTAADSSKVAQVGGNLLRSTVKAGQITLTSGAGRVITEAAERQTPVFQYYWQTGERVKTKEGESPREAWTRALALEYGNNFIEVGLGIFDDPTNSVDNFVASLVKEGALDSFPEEFTEEVLQKLWEEAGINNKRFVLPMNYTDSESEFTFTPRELFVTAVTTLLLGNLSSAVAGGKLTEEEAQQVRKQLEVNMQEVYDKADGRTEEEFKEQLEQEKEENPVDGTDYDGVIEEVGTGQSDRFDELEADIAKAEEKVAEVTQNGLNWEYGAEDMAAVPNEPVAFLLEYKGQDLADAKATISFDVDNETQVDLGYKITLQDGTIVSNPQASEIGGSPYFETIQEAEVYAEKIISEQIETVKQQPKAKETLVKIEEEKLYGYTKDQSVLQQGRVAKILGKKIRTKDLGLVTKEDYITTRIIRDNWKISDTGVLSEQNKEYGQKLNKTETDFALWVQENKNILKEEFDKKTKVREQERKEKKEEKVEFFEDTFTEFRKGDKVLFDNKEWVIEAFILDGKEIKARLIDETGEKVWASAESGVITFAQPKTQKEQVKEVLAEGEAKSIKQIAQETKIKEPNIRRILGVGTKEGEFSRVAEGVYVLKTESGQVAYIETGNALESLPRLAKEGFKADMVFLDIPYDTPAVKGGNRGMKYNFITPEEFGEVLDSVNTILASENSPVIYMFSQAKSGWAKMQKYNEMLDEKGLKVIAKGEWQKRFQNGEKVTNVRGEVAQPEGILLLSQSGEIYKDIVPIDLNFDFVRPKGYQSEKNADMIKEMIQLTTNIGDVVLDPFAGSGVVPAEAIKAGRSAVAIEVDKKVVEETIKPRVEKASKEVKKVSMEDVRKEAKEYPRASNFAYIANRKYGMSTQQATEIWNEVNKEKEIKVEGLVGENQKRFIYKDYEFITTESTPRATPSPVPLDTSKKVLMLYGQTEDGWTFVENKIGLEPFTDKQLDEFIGKYKDRLIKQSPKEQKVVHMSEAKWEDADKMKFLNNTALDEYKKTWDKLTPQQQYKVLMGLMEGERYIKTTDQDTLVKIGRGVGTISAKDFDETKGNILLFKGLEEKMYTDGMILITDSKVANQLNRKFIETTVKASAKSWGVSEEEATKKIKEEIKDKDFPATKDILDSAKANFKLEPIGFYTDGSIRQTGSIIFRAENGTLVRISGKYYSAIKSFYPSAEFYITDESNVKPISFMVGKSRKGLVMPMMLPTDATFTNLVGKKAVEESKRAMMDVAEREKQDRLLEKSKAFTREDMMDGMINTIASYIKEDIPIEKMASIDDTIGYEGEGTWEYDNKTGIITVSMFDGRTVKIPMKEARDYVQAYLDEKKNRKTDDDLPFRKEGRKRLNSDKLNNMQLSEMKKLSREVFGDEKIEIMEQVLTPETINWMGRYVDDMIQIRSGSIDKGSTTYHEIVHRGFAIFLTADEQVKMIKEVRKTVGDDYLIKELEKLSEKDRQRVGKYRKSDWASTIISQYENIAQDSGIGVEGMVKADKALKGKEEQLDTLADAVRTESDLISGIVLKEVTNGAIKYHLLKGSDVSIMYALIKDKQLMGDNSQNFELIDMSDLVNHPQFDKLDIVKTPYHPKVFPYSTDASLRGRQKRFREAIETNIIDIARRDAKDFNKGMYRGAYTETDLDGMAQEWLAENVLDHINTKTPTTFMGKLKRMVEVFIDRWFRTMDNVSDIEDFYDRLLSGNLLQRQQRIDNQRVKTFNKYIKSVSGAGIKTDASYRMEVAKEVQKLTTKILKKLEGKPTVKKQFISDLTKQQDIKQVEKDIINDVLKTFPDEIDVATFEEKVLAELLPLKRAVVTGNKWYDYTLSEDRNSWDYSEAIYYSPVPTMAGSVHFKGEEYSDDPVNEKAVDNYFGHIRIQTSRNENIRRISEVQNDLYQRGRIENETTESKIEVFNNQVKNIRERLNKQIKLLEATYNELKLYKTETSEQELANIQSGIAGYKSDLVQIESKYKKQIEKMKRGYKQRYKLSQYNNPTAHFRTVREEIRQAVLDGMEKILFPSGETAMHIEHLAGQGKSWVFFDEDAQGEYDKLTKDNIKVGSIIIDKDDLDGQDFLESRWVVAHVFGDTGDFIAVPAYQEVIDNNEILYKLAKKKGYYMTGEEADEMGIYSPYDLEDDVLDWDATFADKEILKLMMDINLGEQFNTSDRQEINKEHGTYLFYENTLSKYLKSNYEAKLITDKNGYTWWEVELKPEYAGAVEAFRLDELVDYGKVAKNINKFDRAEFYRKSKQYLEDITKGKTELIGLMSTYKTKQEFLNDMLFHGSSEGAFDGKFTGGGYDGIFVWTTDSPKTAQNYIPSVGGKSFFSFRANLDDVINPSRFNNDKALQELFGLKFEDIKWDSSGREAESWRNLNPVTEREAMDKLKKLGYTFDKWGGIEQGLIEVDGKIQKPDYKETSELYIFSGKRNLNLKDIRVAEEGDLMDVDYNKFDEFKKAKDEGYDGVIINDFGQSDLMGNYNHTSFGLFEKGYKKLQQIKVPAQNFDEWDTYKGELTPELDALWSEAHKDTVKYRLEEEVSVKLPELVSLAENLGANVKLQKSFRKAGTAGDFSPRGGTDSRIRILRTLFDPQGEEVTNADGETERLPETPEQQMDRMKSIEKVLGYEIGHLFDWFGGVENMTLKRGNILGRIGNFRGFLGGILMSPEQQSEYNEAKIYAKDLQYERKQVKGSDKNKYKDLGKQLKITNRRINELEEGALAKHPEVRKELKTMTHLWNPFEESQVPESYLKYRYSSKELYAEALSVLFNDPKLLKTTAPTFYQSFVEYLASKKEVKEQFFAIKDSIKQGTNIQARQDKMTENQYKATGIRATIEQEAEQYKKLTKWENWKTVIKMGIADEYAPYLDLLRKQWKAGGIELSKMEEAEQLLGNLKFMGNKGVKYAEDIQENFFNPVSEAGIDVETIGNILVLERNLGDRIDLANPQGLNYDYAKETYDHIKEQLTPAQWVFLQEKLSWWRDYNFALVEQGYKDGVYSKKFFEEIATVNKNTYTPFAVVEYIHSNYVSAGIIQAKGTLKGVENTLNTQMLKSLSLMRLSASNGAKKYVVEDLTENFKDNIHKAKAIRGEGGKFVRFERNEQLERTGYTLLELLEDGKQSGYYVDKYIVAMFEQQYGSIAWEILRAIATPFREINKVFKPAVTVFRASFQFFTNPIKDYSRSVTNITALSGLFDEGSVALRTGRVFKAFTNEWMKNLKRSWGYTGNQLDAVTERMLELSVLSSNVKYEDIELGNENFRFDAVKNRIVYKGSANFMESLRDVAEKVPVLKSTLVPMYDFYMRAGATLEVNSKIAGFQYLREKVGDEKAAFYTRRYAGTPDYMQGGKLTFLTNNLFPFSNVALQAIRADSELATRPSTASGYWFSTVVKVVLPKLLMLLGASILRVPIPDPDDEDKKIWVNPYDYLSEYYKSMYMTFPIGYDKDTGKFLFVKIPQDEVAAVTGDLIWKMGTYLMGEGMKVEQLSSAILGFIPAGNGSNPLIGILGGWKDYAQGRNPYDDFRGRPAILQNKWNEGGITRLTEMLKWSTNELGVTRFQTYDKDFNTTVEYVLEAPILERMFELTDYGITEREQWEKDMGKKEKNKTLDSFLRSYYAQPSNKSLLKYQEEYVIAVKGERPKDGWTGTEKAEETRLKSEFKREVLANSGNAQFTSIAKSGLNNDEKIKIMDTKTKNSSDSQKAEYLSQVVKYEVVKGELFAQYAKDKDLSDRVVYEVVKQSIPVLSAESNNDLLRELRQAGVLSDRSLAQLRNDGLITPAGYSKYRAIKAEEVEQQQSGRIKRPERQYF